MRLASAGLQAEVDFGSGRRKVPAVAFRRPQGNERLGLFHRRARLVQHRHWNTVGNRPRQAPRAVRRRE